MKIKSITTVIIIGCLWLGTNQLLSQNITTGVRAGIGLNSLNGDDISDGESLVGFNGGLFLNYGISEIFSIQPELNLSMKGANNVTINTFPFPKASISYIQIPVMFQLSAKNKWGDRFLPFLELGPAINLNVTKDLEGQVLEDVPGAYSVDQDVKNVQYDVLVGLGTTIDDIYLVNLRYVRGVSNIFEQGDVKSNSIIFSVGIIF